MTSYFYEKKILPYLLISPVLFVMLVVLIYPFVHTIVLSFDTYGTRESFVFTFDNYKIVVMDKAFWVVLYNTFLYLFFSVLAHFLLGFGAALILNGLIRTRGIFRTLFIVPWTIPPVVVGATWKWIYNPTSGLLNDILMRLGVIEEPILWLSSKSLAMSSIIIANIWRGFPYVMLILLAGLQSVPTQLYEAAETDGANSFSKFRYITLPSLRKNIIVVLALDTVLEARKIDLVHIMTGGGPGKLTEILVTEIYKQYFQFFQFEIASAMAIIASLIFLVISLPYIQGIMKDA